jgi:hypothetical protein
VETVAKTITTTIGLDLGQRRDSTAIIVDEHGDGDTHRIRMIERPRLGTPYPKVIRRVAQIRDRITAQTKSVPTIYCDATGVGRPVVDEFRAKGVDVVPVTITAGEGVTREGSELHIGKLALISRLEVLLSDGRLEWDGSTREGKALTSELHRFQLKVSQAGSLQLEAEKSFHDDLVIALALAVFEAPRFVGVASVDLWGDERESMWRPWP